MSDRFTRLYGFKRYRPSEAAVAVYNHAMIGAGLGARCLNTAGERVFHGSRSDLRDELRRIGFSRKKAKRMAAAAWRVAHPDTATAEAAAAIRAAAARLRR